MKKIFITLFLLFPIMIALCILLKGDTALSAHENRALKTKSTISANVLDGSFQSDLESYLSDQFPMKEALKSAENEMLLTFGKREIENTYIGENGRLFQKITDADVNTEAVLKNAEKINSVAQSTDIPTYVIPIPSAGIALAQLLPDGAPMYRYDELYEQLAERLDAAAVIDIRGAISASPDNYYMTDHHYTTKGAYLAYREWCKAKGNSIREYDSYHPYTAASDFRGTLYSRVLLKNTPYDTIELIAIPDNITVNADGKEIDFYDNSALDTNDKYNVFQGGNHGVTVITNNDLPDGKTLVILKDSFANSIVPFLTYDYAKIIMIDERYTFVDINQILIDYQPDELAVIKEIIS